MFDVSFLPLMLIIIYWYKNVIKIQYYLSNKLNNCILSSIQCKILLKFKLQNNI